MKVTLLVIGILGLLLVGCVSGYICIQEQDNLEVQKFKTKINMLAIQEDLNKGVSEEAILTKIKYFHPCR